MQVLFYPVTDLTTDDRPSYETYGDVAMLRRDAMRQFRDAYAPDLSRRAEPACSPLLAEPAALARVAPAHITLARCDVLYDEGVAYYIKLKAAGVDAELHVEPGVPHGFVMLLGLAEACAAVSRAAAWLETRW